MQLILFKKKREHLKYSSIWHNMYIYSLQKPATNKNTVYI